MDRPVFKVAPRVVVRDGKILPAAGEPAPDPDALEREPRQRTSHSLSPALRDRERILPPGAVGLYGGPYKMLRTQVLQRLDQLGAHTLGVFSPRAGAGKTLTSINLAIAIAAESNRSAVLVDFDMRNPCVAKRLELVPADGVEACLAEGRALGDVATDLTGYDRLTVVPARARAENSSELLARLRGGELIAELARLQPNAVVIFDVPPVLEADDALVLSRILQAGLLVVREGLTARDEVARSIALLEHLPIVGTVLNASRERRPTAY